MAEDSDDALWVLVPTAQQNTGAWIDDTLKLRVAEKGLGKKIPLAGDFPRQRIEVVRGDDPVAAVNELFYRRGWTDGLPVVPPSLGAVEAMLAFTDLDRRHVVAELEPLKGLATMEKIAANAVMAGSRPRVPAGADRRRRGPGRARVQPAGGADDGRERRAADAAERAEPDRVETRAGAGMEV